MRAESLEEISAARIPPELLGNRHPTITKALKLKKACCSEGPRALLKAFCVGARA